MINEFDTIAAIATAVSNAGIGIIRISGEEAMRILSEVFEPYNKKKMFRLWRVITYIMGISKTGMWLSTNV